MKYGIKCNSFKWRNASGRGNNRILVRLSGKLYKTVVRTAIYYGIEFWAVDRYIGQIIRILRWINGVTRKDEILNDFIRKSIDADLIVDKVR